MAEDIHQPHNMMVRAVLSDVAEAASFLQRHLPQEVRQALHWTTLTLREGSFVDEDLRASEADFLYEIPTTLRRGPRVDLCARWNISPRRIAGCGFGFSSIAVAFGT